MRRYGQWAGHPNGIKEDPKHCIVEVASTGRSMHYHQCYRKRGYGPNREYCLQHSRLLGMGHHLNVPEDK